MRLLRVRACPLPLCLILRISLLLAPRLRAPGPQTIWACIPAFVPGGGEPCIAPSGHGSVCGSIHLCMATVETASYSCANCACLGFGFGPFHMLFVSFLLRELHLSWVFCYGRFHLPLRLYGCARMLSGTGRTHPFLFFSLHFICFVSLVRVATRAGGS
jgi:hypothetical protein